MPCTAHGEQSTGSKHARSAMWEQDRVAAGVRGLLSAKDVAEGRRERRGRVGGMVVKSRATINLHQTINKMACAHGPMHVLMPKPT
jgi:hypothetical protein